MSARERHPLAGRTVRLGDRAVDPDGGAIVPGVEYRIEDYWQNVAGGSWMHAEGNPAAVLYGMRSAATGLPLDNEVVYGKVGSLGHLVHVSELGEVDHSHCHNAWKPVQCDRCGRRYVCSPSDDYYCAAEGDHCCERCLLTGAGVPLLIVEDGGEVR